MATDIPTSLMHALKACRTLPSVPAVALQVLELCQDENTSIPKLAKVIACDPALAGKVLKVANSPWCGVQAQVTTLERAVTLLGFNTTLGLALSFSLVRGLCKTKGKRFDHQAYWRRSAIAATATRVAGISVKAARSDELFLAGLLQDIGMLVLSEAVPKTYGPLVASARGDHELLVAAERMEFNVDHAQVGSWLVSKWNLPEVLATAVANSHDPQNVVKLPPLSRAVALGSWIAEIWVNPNIAAVTAFAREAANSHFDISQQHFDKILGEVATALPEVTTNLDINIGGEAAINRLLDEAREALAELTLQAQQEARQIQVQAQRDPLTSFYNRAYLSDLLPQMFAQSQQMLESMTVVFLDIDNFKSINDTYGHDTGDSVLAAVARAIQSATRTVDTVTRYGGDEFVLLIPKSSRETGLMVSERIRSAVEATTLTVSDGKQIQVTVSVGCATTDTHFVSGKQLLEAADRCLYEAKSSGRNRVVAFEASDPVAHAGAQPVL